MARDLIGIDACKLRARRTVEHVGEGDFLARGADLDLDFIIARDERELFGEVIAEQGRAGDGRGVKTRRIEASEGTAAPFGLFATAIAQAQFGIGVGSVGAAFRGRDRPIATEGDHIRA